MYSHTFVDCEFNIAFLLIWKIYLTILYLCTTIYYSFIVLILGLMWIREILYSTFIIQNIYTKIPVIIQIQYLMFWWIQELVKKIVN